MRGARLPGRTRGGEVAHRDGDARSARRPKALASAGRHEGEVNAEAPEQVQAEQISAASILASRAALAVAVDLLRRKKINSVRRPSPKNVGATLLLDNGSSDKRSRPAP